MSLYAWRTWKRDGSMNRMTLDAAVYNLASRGELLAKRGEPNEDAIREALVTGQTLETPLATFALEALSGADG